MGRVKIKKKKPISSNTFVTVENRVPGTILHTPVTS